MAKQCIAILAAAGSGSRFGGGIAKQYVKIGQKTILEYTLEAFLPLDEIKQIIIIVAPDDELIDSIIQIKYFDNKKIKVIKVGGASRAHSVLNGLKELCCKKDDWIMVHDVARCCIQLEDIHRLITDLTNEDNQTGGILAINATDTIKYSENGVIINKTLARHNIYLAQTPQMFRYGVLYTALNNSRLDEVTDEASAVEAIGLPVKLVIGNPNNIKITYSEDILRAKSILNLEQDY